MSIQEQTIVLPDGRVVKTSYPVFKVNPIQPEDLPAYEIQPEIEVTRIDFSISLLGVTVNKLGKNEAGRMIVVAGEVKPKGFSLDGALDWCRAHGWTVRRWPGGARAWKNGLEPVRTKSEVIKLRDHMRLNPRPELEGQGVNLDLVYDL